MCHTDFSEYANGPIFVSGTPPARTGRSVPLVLGHEFSGQIVQTGSDVTELKIGDGGGDQCRGQLRGVPILYSRAGRALFIGRIHRL
jgi:D-arabinose 1-dehydrogenase-like Zn-dependent alcohol dehydrogenase